MRRKCKQPVFWLVFIFALMMFSAKNASAETREGFSVVVPIEQTLANKTLTYELTPKSAESLMPVELNGNQFTLKNGATEKLTFSFVRPGKYSYHLAVIGSGSEAVRAKNKFFDFDILTFYSESEKEQSVVVVKDATGYKVDSIKFQAIPPVPITSTSTRPHSGTPATGKLPQTGDLVKSFSWLGLLFILIALLKMLWHRREEKSV